MGGGIGARANARHPGTSARRSAPASAYDRSELRALTGQVVTPARAVLATFGTFGLYWVVRATNIRTILRRAYGAPKAQLPWFGLLFWPLGVLAAGAAVYLYGNPGSIASASVNLCMIAVYIVMLREMYKLSRELRFASGIVFESWFRRAPVIIWLLAIPIIPLGVMIVALQQDKVTRLAHARPPLRGRVAGSPSYGGGTGSLPRGGGNNPRPYEYWFAMVTHTDEPTSKERPVLVLHRNGSKVWVLKVTSQDQSDRRDAILLDDSRWHRSADDKVSWLKLDQVYTRSLTDFRRRLGEENDSAVRDRVEQQHPGFVSPGVS